MMEEIDHQYLLSLGFDGARISDPDRVLRRLRATSDKIQVQLFKADLIAGQEHLRFAARNALHSFRGKKPRSKSLAVEYLLFVSCQRQISKAISLLGVGPKDHQIVLVGLADSKEALEDLERSAPPLLGGKKDDNIIEIGSKRKMAELRRAYDVSSREIEATRFEGESDSSILKRLIVERSALLTITD